MLILIVAAAAHGVASRGGNTEALQLQPLGAGGVCPTSHDVNAPHARSAMYVCPEYAARACCSEREERVLADELWMYQSVYASCSGCYENVRRLKCAIHCSPDARRFVEVKSAAIIAVRVCPEFCARWSSSCAVSESSSADAESYAFCATQLDSNQAFRVELSQESCWSSPTAPDACAWVAGA